MASTQSDMKPQPGDLIEIFRGVYEHWAVYIGDGFVVHLAPPDEGLDGGSDTVVSVLSLKAIVKKDKLLDVVGNDNWTINNTLDKKYKPFPADNIVKAACVLIGMELPYSISRFNCEHFANELRYHKAVSRQVNATGKKVLVVVAGVAIGLLVSLGIRSLMTCQEEEGEVKEEEEEEENTQ
ncbi:phospholipase A and acyltransferase 2 isoform X1 [Lates calcarifer]|uniref:Phospholipase A and acyltransferase 2 isoform X1 n=1 Tax=Lates calcarifer TaxID=8187 RepID=A0A4W6EZU6_LATCA|nr:phospholipase A and acyltransferase 2 isoform X1 [Lates calcarifer]XP_018515895.1 phospholipase A and acyltransferase 2 isoform X1 [Lates calcarifer]XP_018515896.1 phospholipase A and acyltransferase 2 isoform X1 [Lates calcarifer]XP_018526132.1 phospholipase A and acyltransferase 2-like isoform X1 [Lates calcarifer]XP_018526133.1 phospholipase A and acyltransferase 2-like isoform X1 [Lates calcarifer]XP_018526134.1 phospholipase A and acyltransferase 2-like isoform X1 [Lates calcarifer]XP